MKRKFNYNEYTIFILAVEVSFLDWLDLEMEADEAEYHAFEVLDQVVETAETVRISGLVDVNQGPDLAGGEADVLVPDHDLKLLPPHLIRLYHVLII